MYERGSKEEATALAQQIAEERADGGVITAEERAAFIYFRNRCLALNVNLRDALDKAVSRYEQGERRKNERATIAELANEWYEERVSGNGGRVKVPRPATIREMKQTRNLLIAKWGGLRYATLKKQDLKEFIDSVKHPTTAKKWRARISGWANWVIDSGYAYGAGNPVKNIKTAKADENVPEIVSAEEATKLIRLCEQQEQLRPLIHQITLGLFAGVRPTECERLSWEDITIWKEPNQSKWGEVWGEINIKSGVAKTRRQRRVEINATLVKFLQRYGTTDIFTKTNHRKRIHRLRVTAGYAYGEEITGKKRYTPDLLRHSYASFWLARHHDEAGLAFRMGNSVEVVRKYYVRPMANYQTEEYWAIEPMEHKKGDEEKKVAEENLPF